jgi:hypothetical protein
MSMIGIAPRTELVSHILWSVRTAGAPRDAHRAALGGPHTTRAAPHAGGPWRRGRPTPSAHALASLASRPGLRGPPALQRQVM